MKYWLWYFVDLQEAVDTVEDDIVLSKFEHYGICGLASEWFKSYLSNRKQLMVSVNGYESNLAHVNLVFLKGQLLVHRCFRFISMT